MDQPERRLPQVLCTEGKKAEIRDYFNRQRGVSEELTQRSIARIYERIDEAGEDPRFSDGANDAMRESLLRSQQPFIDAAEANLASTLHFLDAAEAEAMAQCERGVDVDLESAHRQLDGFQESLRTYGF